jgi:hypothetical protein
METFWEAEEWTKKITAGYFDKSGLRRTRTWEEVYQIFKERTEEEAKEKLTKVFGPAGCRCPAWGVNNKTIVCQYLDRDEGCTHPSNKPPEPECDHTDHYQRIPDGYTREHEAVGNKVRSEMPIMLFTYCTECKVVLSVKKPECKHGCIDFKTDIFISYKDLGDKHCRGCGDKIIRRCGDKL